MKSLNPKYIAHVDFTLEYLLQGLKNVNIKLEDILQNQILTVFGRSGPAIEAMFGDYDTSLVPDTPNLRYQTDTQKLYNDATSSIQTQLDSKVSAGDFKTIEGQSIIGVGNIDLNKADVGLSNVDNTSDANKPISIATQIALDLKEDKSNKGIANGYAPLDNNVKIPLIYINDALIGNVHWKGLYNGTIITSSPDTGLVGQPLPTPNSSNTGWYFISVADYTYSGTDYKVGDWIISNGVTWDKVDNTDAVSSVFGRVGNVTAQNGDYTASQITNVPSGNISSITVQDALNELDSEKAIDANVVHLAGDETITGVKTFNNKIVTSNWLEITNSTPISSYTNNVIGRESSFGNIFMNTTGKYPFILNGSNISSSAKTFTFPNQSGTFALTSDLTPYALDANVLHKTLDETKNGRLIVDNTVGTASFTGMNTIGIGVRGVSDSASGVSGASNLASGVSGTSTSSYGVVGNGTAVNFAGVYGNSVDGFGVLANSTNGIGFRVNNSVGNTSDLAQFGIGGSTVAKINNLGNITATQFIKSGAPSTNILLAGGSDISQSTFVPSTRTISINGVTQDLSANRQYRAGLSNTGVLTYGGINVGSSTTVNIGAVTGVITDNETTPGTPSYQLVTYAGATNITVPTIGGGTGTYVLLNSSGTIVFQNTFPTSAQRKSMIYLSKISHPNLSTISFGIDEPDYVNSPLQQFRDLFQVIQYMNQGITISGNAGLTINSTNGVILGDGINFVLDKTNPNMLSVAAGAPRNFLLLNQSGAVGSFVTTIDPANYDVGGVTTPIGGSVNNTTIQYLYYAPGVGFAILRGQTVYPTLLDAVSAVGRESFVLRPNLVNNSILIAAICLRRTTTAMNDPAYVRILLADKFGQIGGASSGISVTNLQTAYNNSLVPQITTTSALGAFTLRNGGALDTDNVFAIQNIAGATTASINGNGAFTGTSWNGYTPANDANVVHKTGSESIFIDNTGGIKTFNNTSTNNPSILLLNSSSAPGLSSTNSSTGTSVHLSNLSSGTGILVNGAAAATGFNYVGQNAGINTFTVNKLGTITGTSFVKSGATATNILLAGGTDIPQSTFQTALTNPVTGTGTTNYLPKWTSGSALGSSSMQQDASGNITIAGGSGDDTLILTKATGASIAIEGATGTTNKVKLVASNSTNPDFQILVGGSERMRITDTGNVGIGTTNPLSRTQINKASQTIGTTIPSGALLISDDVNTVRSLELGVDTGNSISYIQARSLNSTDTFNLALNPSGGNVGIGTTTSPDAKLDVESTVAGGLSDALTITNLSSTANSEVGLFFSPTIATGNIRGSRISSVNDGNNAIDLRFTTGNGATITEKMRITPTGNVLIGTTTEIGGINPKIIIKQSVDIDWNGLLVKSSGDDSFLGLNYNGSRYAISSSYSSTAGFKPLVLSTGGIDQITLSTAGVVQINNLSGTGTRTVVADSVGNLSAPVSDESLKENIQPLHYGLNEIMKMSPVSYNFKDKEKYGDGLYLGNIAQDMEKVIPEAVFTDSKTGKMGIEYSHMHAVYIKAIQEQQEIINKLLLRIERLENK